MNNNQTSEKSEFNLFSEENVKDQFAMFKQMRSRGSVVPVPNPMGGAEQTWIITRMDVAMEVLKDHSRFTVDMNSIDNGNDIRKNLSDDLGSSEPQTFLPESRCSLLMNRITEDCVAWCPKHSLQDIWKACVRVSRKLPMN
ncbi:hypothetical protein [Paenibacillus amylolyticus]|uniref:hypothetical protein n=1 Tax=Paenibacillus amylolyticus TaxID=1451 RepID=UPI003D8069BC